MLKKRALWIALVLTLFMVGGYFYFLNQQDVAEADEEPALQTSVVRQGNLTISATGAGSIVAASEINLGFGTTGTITEILVSVGDEVTAGDVIARLDDTAAREALFNAQLQVSQSALKVDSNATSSGTSYNAIALEQAEINLAAAEAALATLLSWEPDPNEIALAESNLAAAQASFQSASAQSSASGNNATVANINVEQAQRDYDAALENYETAHDPARDWELNDGRLGPQLEREREATANALLRAEENLTIARANYATTVANINDNNVYNAEIAILNAELALESALSGPTEEQIEAAEAALRQAELGLQQTLLGIEADLLTMQQAQMALLSAEQAVADTILVAPIDGTIMALNAAVGEQGSNGVFVTLANLTIPMVEIFLDETDLDNVGIGFPTELIFDALPDDTFNGHIIQVDPQLTVSGGVSVVRALVQLDDFAKQRTLPIGMNATVDVISGQAANAMLIPVEALRDIGEGQFGVFVVENDVPQLRIVEVGLRDFTFAEILAGLNVGDVISTGIVDTN